MSQDLLALSPAGSFAQAKSVPTRILSALAVGVRSALETMLLWRQRWRERHELARMDHRMRRDIGLSNVDVWREINKPVWRT
jgi:uncharacterized protein YjiS (DUF1127 family)